MAARDPSLVRAADAKCFGARPLIHAVNVENRAMVELLLELGAEIDERSDWWAGGFGVLDGASPEMAEFLLGRGATLTAHAAARLGKAGELRAMLERDPTLVHARGGDGQTPLHFAATPRIAELLLARGAVIDVLDIDHASTPAQWGAGVHPDVGAYLVSRGAGADPFMAVRIGDVALLEKLIGGEPAGVEVRVTRKRFPVAPPAAGHIYLYTIGEGCGLLHAAAACGQAGAIRWLAAHGADVGARAGYDDATALHSAAWHDHAGAAMALVDAGADIDAVSGPMHRNEPIGWAIVGGSYGAFRALKERGAKVRAHHIEDAKKGAAGEFRGFNPRKGVGEWGRIAAEL